ncbi:hypothetical protein ACOMHN_061491 [Nucella lapillus]
MLPGDATAHRHSSALSHPHSVMTRRRPRQRPRSRWVLKDGSLRDNQVTEGSRLVLCPNMESGTSPSRAEHSVIQALKNLSQSQIHDFLSGRAPLTLAIRLGEHLMFVQLQLSTCPSLSLQPTPPSTPAPASPPPSPPTSGAQRGGVGEGRAGGPKVVPKVDPVSLLQASHKLTERLRELTHLTQQALQSGPQRSATDPSLPLTPPPSPPPSPGAVIDSMQHMGKGVYSGTFSGTLDPRLQDTSGQPRRDVNTILHILHDLLLARPSPLLSPPSPLLSPPTPRPPPLPLPPHARRAGGGRSAPQGRARAADAGTAASAETGSPHQPPPLPPPPPRLHLLPLPPSLHPPLPRHEPACGSRGSRGE